MRTKVIIHTCDICGKQDNLGDQYESEEGVLHLKGTIGSSYGNGGASWDDSYDLCPDCFKEFKKIVADKKKSYQTKKL